jgi:hypothetical protein
VLIIYYIGLTVMVHPSIAYRSEGNVFLMVISQNVIHMLLDFNHMCTVCFINCKLSFIFFSQQQMKLCQLYCSVYCFR